MSEESQPLKRVNYFHGQLLTDQDFRDEQEYFREKLRLHNRLLHGAGIVEGLEVSVSESQKPHLKVSPGFAIDPRGEEIQVQETVAARLPAEGTVLYVALRYREHFTDPVPAPDDGYNYSRIEEGFDITLEPKDPCRGKGRGKRGHRESPAVDPGPAIPLARIVRRRSGWRLDRRFQPPRAR